MDAMRLKMRLDSGRGRRTIAGFSLIEITLALGIVCFSMLPILGLLPIGLSTLSDAATRTGEANIAKEISSELQQVPLSYINSLLQQTYYYDRSGTPVQNAQDAFFSASFALGSPEVPGLPTGYTSIAKTVTVTLRYPQNIPTTAQKTRVFSLLIAQQSGS